MKKLIALLVTAAIFSLQAIPAAGDGYINRAAVATSSNVLTLEDGQQIRLYNNDVLLVGETYILLIDKYNDNELLNYTDLETYELENMK